MLNVRLTGKKEEIDDFVTALTIAGYKFSQGREYYPQRNSNDFAFYLKGVWVPPGATEPKPIAQSDDPQPRSWDAVLGGKGQGGQP